jgi:hypothetical protein
VRANGHVAIFTVFKTSKMAQTFDETLNVLEDETVDVDDAGISTDEEEDLDRRLATSDSEPRQVFICSWRTDVVEDSSVTTTCELAKIMFIHSRRGRRI